MELSSYEVEYIAAFMCACQDDWLMNLMKELCSEEYEVVTLKIDNVVVINLAKNHISHERSKHINDISLPERACK